MIRDRVGVASAALPTEPDDFTDAGQRHQAEPNPANRIRSILIATDANEIAANAVRAGLALRDLLDARAELLSVLPSRLLPVAPIYPGFVAAEIDTGEQPRRERRMADVLAQLELVRGSAQGATVTVRVGDPALTIVRTAVERDAQLIALGLRQHSTLDRLFRDQTALRVMRLSPVAVLAVTPLLATVPRRILVGMDFSRASVRVARTAAQLLPTGGTLLVAHAQPDAGPASSETEGAHLIYARGISASFARLRHDLGMPRDVHIEPVILHGPAAPELLSLADRSAADVIAVGSHRRPALDRVLLGSVTAAIARAARCSMLVVAEPEV